MAFRLVRRTRIVMLMVSACPESGLPGTRRPIAKSVLSWRCTMQHSCRMNVLAADRGKVSVAAGACWRLAWATKRVSVIRRLTVFAAVSAGESRAVTGRFREKYESSHRTGEAVRGRLRSVTSRLTCSNRL
jgi:hypothetical protein